MIILHIEDVMYSNRCALYITERVAVYTAWYRPSLATCNINLSKKRYFAFQSKLVAPPSLPSAGSSSLQHDVHVTELTVAADVTSLTS